MLHIYKESLAKSGKSAPPKRKARKQKKNKEETEEPHEEAGTREEYEIQDEEEELLDVPSTPALFSNNTEQIQANQEIISINDKLFFVLEKRNLVPQDDEDYEAMMLKLKEWSEALYFKGIYTRHLDEGNFSSADLKQLSCNFKEELFGILKEFEDANIIEGLVSGIASFYIRCGGPFIKSSLLPKEKGINYVLASFE